MHVCPFWLILSYARKGNKKAQVVSLSLDSTMAKLVQRCTDHFFDWRDMLRKTAIAILTKATIPAPRRRLL
jgi:hypothetical protein